MFLEEINLNFIQPCTTDSKRIRIIATPSRDVSELFPYLNTYLKINKKQLHIYFVQSLFSLIIIIIIIIIIMLLPATKYM